MMKLVLSGAAFAALAVGPALAADVAPRPINRAAETVQSTSFAPQRPPISTPWGRYCWVDTGSWQPCRSLRAKWNAGRAPVNEARARPEHEGVAQGGGRFVEQCTGGVRRQYWATSLGSTLDSGILDGLQAATARGEVGWLDIDPGSSVPTMGPGTNLVFYHVGGNCYTGSDCDRFPSSKPTGDQLGNKQRQLDLNDPKTRAIIVADLVGVIRKADQEAPRGATVGVHLDNVHKLDADGLARIFNDYLQAIETAKRDGSISKDRTVGYVAKNNPHGFMEALDRGLLRTAPLYQISTNAILSETGVLDEASRDAQEIGRRHRIPVFLKTFGSDVAYSAGQDGRKVDVYVSEEMTRQMAKLPHVSGAAWSRDEASYRPTLFVQGAPVDQGRRICKRVPVAQAPATPPMARTAEAGGLRPVLGVGL